MLTRTSLSIISVVIFVTGVVGWGPRSNCMQRSRESLVVKGTAISREDFLSSVTTLSLATTLRPEAPTPVFPVSRAEVTLKLNRIPIFFVSDENGGISLNKLGQGQFFFEKEDADAAGIMLRPDRTLGSCTWVIG